MPPLAYLILRLVRHNLSSTVVHWLMQARVLIQPGLETRHPDAAAKRYLEAIEKQNKSLQDKKVLVLGYGGYLGLGVALLRMGAKHVTLLDPYPRAFNLENMRLASDSAPFVTTDGDKAHANPDFITIHHKPIGEVSLEEGGRVDFVLSSSVFEHLIDPFEVARSLSQWSEADGTQIHFVDLRDHFFRYPFEMLCHSEATWRNYLNPSSHLNRMRIWDYEAAFKEHFEKVDIEIVEHDIHAYRKNMHRIRQEYISGDENRDAATKIAIFASLPKIST